MRFEQVQHLECRDALARRRKLEHVVAAIVGLHRLDPLGRVLREIVEREEAAFLVRERDETLGDFALVEGLATAFGNHLERLGEGRVLEHFADPRGLTVLEVNLRCVRVGAAHLGRFDPAPVARDHFGHRHALLGILDTRREQFLEALRAELLSQFVPAIDAAGHGPTQRPGGRNLRHPFVFEERHVRLARSPAVRVQSVKLLRLRVPDDGEEVAAHAARHRFHEPHRGTGRDGGIDGVAAILENVQPDLSRNRMARRNDPVRGNSDGASGLPRHGRRPIRGEGNNRYEQRDQEQAADEHGEPQDAERRG